MELWITQERMILVTWGFPHPGELAELGALSSRPEEKKRDKHTGCQMCDYAATLPKDAIWPGCCAYIARVHHLPLTGINQSPECGRAGNPTSRTLPVSLRNSLFLPAQSRICVVMDGARLQALSLTSRLSSTLSFLAH